MVLETKRDGIDKNIWEVEEAGFSIAAAAVWKSVARYNQFCSPSSDLRAGHLDTDGRENRYGHSHVR